MPRQPASGHLHLLLLLVRQPKLCPHLGCQCVRLCLGTWREGRQRLVALPGSRRCSAGHSGKRVGLQDGWHEVSWRGQLQEGVGHLSRLRRCCWQGRRQRRHRSHQALPSPHVVLCRRLLLLLLCCHRWVTKEGCRAGRMRAVVVLAQRGDCGASKQLAAVEQAVRGRCRTACQELQERRVVFGWLQVCSRVGIL